MSTTILKGLRLIEYLAHADGPKGISEIARDIDLNKSAVQRIIGTLNKADYVEQAPGSSKYQLTLSIWELGSHVVARHGARRLLHPILRFGARTSGFTVFLTYFSFPFVVYLDKVEGAHGRAHTAEPGTRIPMTKTAAGKAVLAFLPHDELAGLARDHSDWTGFMKYNGTSIEELKDEIELIRQRRFSTSEGGLKPGVNSVAAPIWWRDSRPYGSIVLTAEDKNMPSERFAEIGASVRGMAEEATLALGGTPLWR